MFLQAGCPSCRPTNSVNALKHWISGGGNMQRGADRGAEGPVKPLKWGNKRRGVSKEARRATAWRPKGRSRVGFLGREQQAPAAHRFFCILSGSDTASRATLSNNLCTQFILKVGDYPPDIQVVDRFLLSSSSDAAIGRCQYVSGLLINSVSNARITQ